MPGQARDHAEDGSVRVGAQAHLLAQGALVDPFAAHIGGGIVRAQGAVRLGVKDVGVDAVRNAPQPRVAQHAVQAVGIIRIAQLLGIGLGNRRDDVRKLDGALHHVDRAVERQARAVFIRQTENIVEERRIGPALILHVVDGEDELRLRAPVMVQRAQIRRRHGRLPVVAVQDIGLEVKEVQRGHHGLREIGEALTVVEIAVDGAARAEIVVVVDEVDLQLLAAGLQAQNADIALTPGQLHGERADLLRFDGRVLLDALVVRQEQADLISLQLGQRVGKRLHHVAQAARFDERGSLGGDHCDPHTTSPLLNTSG